jgi:hypothetical protein
MRYIATIFVILFFLSPAAQAGVWDFAVIGHPRAADNFTVNPVFEEAIATLNKLEPNLVFLNGDLVFGGLSGAGEIRKEWDIFLKTAKQIKSDVFYAAAGHDMSTPAMETFYHNNISPSKYSFRYAGTKFIVLDSYRSIYNEKILEDQLIFLSNELNQVGEGDVFVMITPDTLWYNTALKDIKRAFGYVNNTFPTTKNWWEEVHPLFEGKRGVVISGDAGTREVPYSYFQKDNITYINSGISSDPGKDNHILLMRVSKSEITPFAVNTKDGNGLGKLYRADNLGVGVFKKLWNSFVGGKSYAFFFKKDLTTPIWSLIKQSILINMGLSELIIFNL